MLTYRDATALYASNIPDRKLIMYKAGGIFSRTDKGMEPEYIATRMTTADFFPMFEVPFMYGSAWDAKADAGPEPVVVLSKETNQKAFGGENSVGKTIRVARSRVSRHRRARRLRAPAQVLRREQWLVHRDGRRLRPLRLGPGARARQRRQHQLLEDRDHRQLPGLPQFRMHLVSRLVRAAHRREAARLPRIPRQLRHRAEEARPLSAPAEQLPVRRRRLAEAQQGGRRRQQGHAGHGVRLPRGLPGEHRRTAAGQVPERRAAVGRAARARRQPPRHLPAAPDRIRRGGAGRRHRRRPARR